MRRNIIVTLAIIWLAAGIVGAQAPERGGRANQAARLIVPAVFEERATYVTLGGRLAPVRRVDQTAAIAGVVTAIHVSPGAWVRENDPLLSVRRDVPGETYLPSVARARISGRVSDVKPVVGSEVSANSLIISLIDDSSLTLDALVSDRDAHRIRAIGPKNVVARSVDGDSFKGALSGISLEPDYSTGLFTARFVFPAAPGARVGMVLFMELPVELVRGLFIPRTLVQRRFGRSMLWVVDADRKLALKEAVAGRVFGEEICITGGIAEGESVLRAITGKEREGMALDEWETIAKEQGASSGTAPAGSGMGRGPGGR